MYEIFKKLNLMLLCLETKPFCRITFVIWQLFLLDLKTHLVRTKNYNVQIKLE